MWLYTAKNKTNELKPVVREPALDIYAQEFMIYVQEIKNLDLA